jgi:hypothetical protein
MKKKLELNEETILLALGFLIMLVIGFLTIKYFQKNPEQINMSEETYCMTGYSNISLKDTPTKCLKYFIGGGEK